MAVPKQMKWRNKWILAANEQDYGVEPSIDAANAIQTRNLTVTSYGGSPINRELDKASLGNDTQIMPSPHAQLQFEVELTGVSSAGDTPAFAALLKGAGIGETVTASEDATYDAIDEDHASVAFNFFHHGMKQTILGARATQLEIVLERGQIPFLRFTFMGRYQRPVAASPVSPNVSAFNSPRPINEANTQFELGGEELALQSLTIAYGLQTPHRDLPNRDEIIISDRRMTAQISVEAPRIDDYNLWPDVESHQGITTVAMELIHGTAPGRITIAPPNVQLGPPQPSETDGITIYQMDSMIVPGESGECPIIFD